MTRNKIIPLFATLALLSCLYQASCKSSEKRRYDPKEALSKRQQIKPSNDSVDLNTGSKALVITPKLAELFPHLDGSVGHVLLANANIQAVFSSLPDKDDETSIQATLLNLFMQEEEAGWKKVFGLNSLQLLPNDATFRLSKVDFNHDADGQFAMLVYHFRKKAESHLITLAVLLERNSHAISFIQSYPGNNAAKKPAHSWQLNLASSNIALPSNYLDSTSKQKLFSPWLFFVGQSTPFAIGSYHTRLRWQPALARSQSITIKPTATHVLDLKVGSSAISTLPIATSARLHCSMEKSESPGRDNSLVYAITSFRKEQNCVRRNVARDTKPVVFEIDGEENTSVSDNRILWIHVPESDYGTLIANKAGSTVKTRLPDISEITIRDLQQNQISKHFEDRRAASANVFIEGRDFGDLYFQPRNPDQSDYSEAAIVRIVYTADPETRILQLRETEHTSLGHNAILVNSWPLSLELPVGNYRIEVLNSLSGKYCTSAPKIDSNEATFDHCAIGTTKKTDSNSLSYLPLNPNETALDRPLYNATGIDLIPQVVGDEAKSYIKSPGSFGIFQYHSPINKLAVNAFPIDESIRLKWQAFLERHPDHNDSKQFAKFIRQMAPEAILEVGCRPSTISHKEYGLSLKRLNPEALQYYNCHDTTVAPSEQAKWLAGLIKAINRPLSLTSANLGETSLPSLHYLPKIYLGTKTAGIAHTENITGVVRQGHSMFMTGAAIEENGDEAKQGFLNSKIVNNSNGRFMLVGSFNLETSPHIGEFVLHIFSENGLIRSEAINISNHGQKKEVVIKIALKSVPRFLRYELRGRDDRFRTIKESVLAGTGFFDISQQPLAR